MSRDASDRAQKASDMAVSTANDYGAKSGALQNQLTGLYSQEYSNPTGMGAADMAAARTAGSQGAGGGVSAAVGQGNLEAARTGNSGGMQYALGDAARSGIQTASDNALRVQNENAAIKQMQKAQGISGLQTLQSGDASAQLGAMGANNGAINAETNAGNSGWFQNLTGFMNAAANGAKAAGEFV